jgi:hypothetical protein
MTAHYEGSDLNPTPFEGWPRRDVDVTEGFALSRVKVAGSAPRTLALNDVERAQQSGETCPVGFERMWTVGADIHQRDPSRGENGDSQMLTRSSAVEILERGGKRRLCPFHFQRRESRLVEPLVLLIRRRDPVAKQRAPEFASKIAVKWSERDTRE